MMKSLKLSHTWSPIIIFIAAFFLRIFIFKSVFRPQVFDGFFYNCLLFPKYAWIAKRLATHSFPVKRTLDFSPLYTYMIYILYKVFSGRYLLYKLFQVVIGSINCVLIYKISSALFNTKIALVAGFISIFYKPLILYGYVLEPATIVIFLNLLSVYLLIFCYNKTHSAAPDESSGHIAYPAFILIWLLPGVTLGLSFITRPNIIPFLLLVPAWIFTLYYKKNLMQFTIAMSTVALCFLLIVCPVLVKNYRAYNKILKPLMSSCQVFYQGNNPMATGFYGAHPYLLKKMEMDPYINPDNEPDFAHELYRLFVKENEEDAETFWYKRSINFIKRFPLTYIRLLGAKFRFFWSHYEIHDILRIYYLDWEMERFPLLGAGIIIPFALFGMLLCIKNLKQYFLLYAMIANYILSNLIFFISSRQRLPALPFLIPFSACAIYECIRSTICIFTHDNIIRQPLLFSKNQENKKTGISPAQCQCIITLIGGLIIIGLLYIMVNLPSAQLEQFETMLNVNRDSRIQLMTGYDSLNRRKFKDAKRAFQLAYNLLPFHDTRVPNRFLGGIKEKYKNALRFWELVSAEDQDNVYARFNLGYLLFKDAQYDRAIKEFRALASRTEEGFYGYILPITQPGYYIARSFEQKGEWNLAISEYEKIDQEKPGLPWIRTHLIALYEHTGQKEKAFCIKNILDNLDNPISSSYLLAEAYYSVGEYKKAVTTLETTRSEILNLYSPFHLLLSACYASLGQGMALEDPENKMHLIDHSIEEYRKGLKLDTSQDLVYPEIASAYLEAQSHLNAGLNLYYELGMLYYHLGELDKSKAYLKKAVSCESDKIPDKIKESIKMTLREIDLLIQYRLYYKQP